MEGRLWDDADIPALARMAEKVHEHGSLAGIELCHNGSHGANLYSRQTPMAVGHMPSTGTTRCRRGGWTSTTSPTCADGTARPCGGRSRRASTSSTSTRVTA